MKARAVSKMWTLDSAKDVDRPEFDHTLNRARRHDTDLVSYSELDIFERKAKTDDIVLPSDTDNTAPTVDTGSTAVCVNTFDTENTFATDNTAARWRHEPARYFLSQLVFQSTENRKHRLSVRQKVSQLKK